MLVKVWISLGEVAPEFHSFLFCLQQQEIFPYFCSTRHVWDIFVDCQNVSGEIMNF